MGYQKISEFISKKLYNINFKILTVQKEKLEIKKSEIDNFLNENGECILKADQFVKRRGKKGLVTFVKSYSEINTFINSKDYTNFILEPKYKIKHEYYICLKRTLDNIEYIFNKNGGINLIDPYENGIFDTVLDNFLKKCKEELNELHHNSFENLVKNLELMFNENDGNLLEINPLGLISENDKEYFLPLDFAFQIDSTAVDTLPLDSKNLLKYNPEEIIKELDIEKKIKELDSKTGASLKFTVLNKTGKIWTLIAGGGASVLFTDALSRMGYANEIANYGEYSGNPTTEEVYNYCSLIFDFLGNQKRDFEDSLDHVKLYIGGGVSNFTDVGKTFQGIVKAIEEKKELLKENRVQVYVRRGGVNEKEGLKCLKSTLDRLSIKNIVYGSEEFITKIVSDSLVNKNDHQKILYNDKYITEANNIKYTLQEFNLWNNNLVFYGMHKEVIQRMIDFDYHVGKMETSVKYIINPFAKKNNNASFFFGSSFIYIPIISKLDDFKKILENTEEEYTAVNFSSHRSAYDSTIKLLDIQHIKAITIIAEGIPEKKAIELKSIARNKNKIILGPSSVGAIKAGEYKLGNVCGKMDNIKKCQLGNKGNIGLITKSGGLLNDMISWLSSKNMFINQAIAIGGDRFPCIRFVDVINYYNKNPEIEYIIVIGEEGGTNELEISKLIKDLNIQKKIFAWCSGISSDFFNREIEFGHAGASASCQIEKANFKNYYLRKNGVYVPNSFEELPELIFENITNMKQTQNKNLKEVPMDLNDAIKENKIRINPEIISRVTDERKELCYRNININNILNRNNSLGFTIGLLWFNVELDGWASEYLEKIISIMADHGPAVSGAQNTIVCSRAGKNIVESLSAGLLTIGPRFGGAISDAAINFYESYRNNIDPTELINNFKKNNKYIPGIGHKIKSIHNPDQRVVFLKDYILNNFPNKEVCKYAIKVEEITTKKKGNLILNVDGIIGASLVDLLKNYVSNSKLNNLLQTDILNGLFCLSRSIGFIAHYQDQKELNSSLYRTPPFIIKYEKD